VLSVLARTVCAALRAGIQSERDLRRIIGTLRRELLDRLLVVNEHHLRRVLTEYLRHYNAARHRSLGQLTPAQADTRRPEPVNIAEHRIRRKAGPRRTHPRVLRRCLTAHGSPPRIVFPRPTGRP
jgi:integrase-like protein